MGFHTDTPILRDRGLWPGLFSASAPLTLERKSVFLLLSFCFYLRGLSRAIFVTVGQSRGGYELRGIGWCGGQALF